MNYTDINKKIHLYDLITVGAGPAGLAVAKTVYNHGIKNQIVLEARNYIGGRVLTNDHYGEEGGASFHIPKELADKSIEEIAAMGRPYQIIDFALKNNFKFTRDDGKTWLFKNGQRVPEEEIDKANAQIEDRIAEVKRQFESGERKDDISMYEALGKIKNRTVKMLLRTQYSTADMGLDPKKISFVEYMNTVPGTIGFYPDKGMGKLIQRYAKKIKHLVSVEKEATKIFYDKDKVSVEYKDLVTGNIETIYGKKLALTPPPSVLKRWKSNRHNLPVEFTETLNKFTESTLNKIFIEMNEKFFEIYGIKGLHNIIIRTGSLDEDIIFIAMPNNKPVLAGLVGGNTSLKLEAHGGGSQDKAIRYGLSILKTAFDPKIVEDNFISGRFTSWNRDKYSRCAYSEVTIGNFDARREYSKPIDGKIYPVGEAYLDEEFKFHTHIIGALNNGEVVGNMIYRDLLNEKSLSHKR